MFGVDVGKRVRYTASFSSFICFIFSCSGPRAHMEIGSRRAGIHGKARFLFFLFLVSFPWYGTAFTDRKRIVRVEGQWHNPLGRINWNRCGQQFDFTGLFLCLAHQHV